MQKKDPEDNTEVAVDNTEVVLLAVDNTVVLLFAVVGNSDTAEDTGVAGGQFGTGDHQGYTGEAAEDRTLPRLKVLSDSSSLAPTQNSR